MNEPASTARGFDAREIIATIGMRQQVVNRKQVLLAIDTVESGSARSPVT